MLKKSIRVLPAVGILGLVIARLFRRREHEAEHKPFFRRLVTH